jgi:hypothetical protein
MSGAGIGSGLASDGNSTVGSVTILNGNITASSPDGGAGIGAGYGSYAAISLIENLSILGGKITANGTLTGTGSGGEGGEVQFLKFSGNTTVTCDSDPGKFPVNASSIVLSNGSLIFTTPRNQLFGVSPSSSGLLNLLVMYEIVTTQWSESLSQLNVSLLQIGNITAPESRDWKLCICGECQQECYLTQSSVVKSLIVSVGSKGNHSVKMLGHEISGFLKTNESVSSFAVVSSRSFFAEATFVQFAASWASPHATATACPLARPTGPFIVSSGFRAS